MQRLSVPSSQDRRSPASGGEEPRRKSPRAASLDATRNKPTLMSPIFGTDAKVEQQRQRIAARGQAVRTRTAALRSACRILQHELGEQRTSVDSVTASVTHELCGTLYQQFRATKLLAQDPLRKKASLAMQPLQLQPFARLLDALDEECDPPSLQACDLVAAIQSVVAENSRLREGSGVASAKVMLLERKLRSVCDDMTIKNASLQRTTKIRHDGEALIHSIQQRVAHLDMQAEATLSDVVGLEARRDAMLLEMAQVEADIAEMKVIEAAAKEEAAMTGSLAAEKRKVALLRKAMGDTSPLEKKTPVDVDAVVGRIFKRHESWQQGFDAVCQQHRESFETAVLRQALDRVGPATTNSGEFTQDEMELVGLVPQPSITVMSPSLRHLVCPVTPDDRPVGEDMLMVKRTSFVGASRGSSFSRNSSRSSAGSPVSPGMVSYQLPASLGGTVVAPHRPSGERLPSVSPGRWGSFGSQPQQQQQQQQQLTRMDSVSSASSAHSGGDGVPIQRSTSFDIDSDDDELDPTSGTLPHVRKTSGPHDARKRSSDDSTSPFRKSPRSRTPKSPSEVTFFDQDFTLGRSPSFGGEEPQFRF